MNSSDPTLMEQTGSTAAQELTVDDVVHLQTVEQSVAQEPTTSSQETESATTLAATPAPQAGPTPIPPRFPFRRVSGRYLSSGAGFQLELRVDVDGIRPLRRVSGDFFQVLGATTTYFGSFVVNSPTITVTAGAVIIEGLGSYTWQAGAPKIRVTIARRIIFQPPAPATVQFFTLANQPGASYLCQFVSAFFRTLQIETDSASDVVAPLFQQYNTGSLPSGGAGRTLSVVSAYAEAGIEMQPVAPGPSINVTEAGSNQAWSDSELEAAMAGHFSLFHNEPQWKVWEFAAEKHELGPGLLGIMFDYQDEWQRQGCAVFYEGLQGVTSDKLRLQLYTYVHELGHCFNLLHSWQKSLATPPQANRPSAFSWMNYPWLFPGGVNAFWSGFPFQFDDPELLHLRHAFRNDVIMGGNNFAIGAALEDPQTFNQPIQENTGLQLELSVSKKNKRFLFGEPVTVNVKLTATDANGKVGHTYLHPSAGLLQLGICDPAGNVKTYRPLIEHCVSGEQVQLEAGTPIETSVYCGFGKDGFYFDRTGFYQVRAIYTALDGSKVFSNILRLRVSHPVTEKDEDVASLFFGEQQGTLLYLLGSDAPHLQRGNDALTEVLENYPEHPLAEYVRLMHGVNDARNFKFLPAGERKIIVRKARHENSIKLLSSIVDNSEKGKTPIDPLTVRDNVLTTLLDVQREYGDTAAAAKVEEKIEVRKTRAAKMRKAA
jgi:hypothetical protein